MQTYVGLRTNDSYLVQKKLIFLAVLHSIRVLVDISIRRLVDAPISKSEKKSDGVKSGGLGIQVITHKKQKYASWIGGSLLGETRESRSYSHTNAGYDEI